MSPESLGFSFPREERHSGHWLRSIFPSSPHVAAWDGFSRSVSSSLGSISRWNEPRHFSRLWSSARTRAIHVGVYPSPRWHPRALPAALFSLCGKAGAGFLYSCVPQALEWGWGWAQQDRLVLLSAAAVGPRPARASPQP